MGEKVMCTMDKFLSTTREPGETLLKYFFRCIQLYKGSNNISGTDWENDSIHASALYSKIYSALYEEERREISRRLDHLLENGTLTVSRLKLEMIDISKMSNSKIEAEAPKRRYIMPAASETFKSEDIFCD